MTGVTCVILAAGSSTRMGTQKLLLPLGSGIVLDRAIAACAGFPTVIVASPAVAAHLEAAPASADAGHPPFTVTVNTQPERGMSHSLRLADAAVPAGHAVVVVPADFSLLTSDLVAEVASTGSADIAYPIVRENDRERPGHPVRFGPRARALLGALPDGDTLRALRDALELTRAVACIAPPETQRDIDSPADYERAKEDR